MSTTEIAWKKMYAQKKKRTTTEMAWKEMYAQKKRKRTKMVTIIQRVEYQVQVEVSEDDLNAGMDAHEIIEKYLKGMPNWYGGGETVYIDDNDDE